MKRLIALTLGLVLAAPVLAHTDEMLDKLEAPHGGQLRMAGPYHYELVLKSDGLEVWVTDHAGQPGKVAGATGNVTVLSGKTKQTVELKPAGESHLSGAGSFDPTARTKAVVSIRFPGQPVEQNARFDVNAPAHSHSH